MDVQQLAQLWIVPSINGLCWLRHEHERVRAL
jgi:hypothetical protein